MTYTKHGQLRMSQRAITAEMIEVVETFGEVDGNRLSLDPAVIQRILKRLDHVRSALVHLMDKGGLAAVLGDDGQLVTAYTFKDCRCRRSRRGSWLAA